MKYIHTHTHIYIYKYIYMLLLCPRYVENIHKKTRERGRETSPPTHTQRHLGSVVVRMSVSPIGPEVPSALWHLVTNSPDQNAPAAANRAAACLFSPASD